MCQLYLLCDHKCQAGQLILFMSVLDRFVEGSVWRVLCLLALPLETEKHGNRFSDVRRSEGAFWCKETARSLFVEERLPGSNVVTVGAHEAAEAIRYS